MSDTTPSTEIPQKKLRFTLELTPEAISRLNELAEQFPVSKQNIISIAITTFDPNAHLALLEEKTFKMVRKNSEVSRRKSERKVAKVSKMVEGMSPTELNALMSMLSVDDLTKLSK